MINEYVGAISCKSAGRGAEGDKIVMGWKPSVDGRAYNIQGTRPIEGAVMPIEVRLVLAKSDGTLALEATFGNGESDLMAAQELVTAAKNMELTANIDANHPNKMALITTASDPKLKLFLASREARRFIPKDVVFALPELAERAGLRAAESQEGFSR